MAPGLARAKHVVRLLMPQCHQPFGFGYGYGRKLASTSNFTIGEVLRSTPDLSLLFSLVSKLSPALQAEIYSTAAQLTLFAPTNEALSKLLGLLSEAEKAALLSNSTALTALLSYHIVPQALPSEALKVKQQIVTALGSDRTTPLVIKVLPSGSIEIEGKGSSAKVVKADMKAGACELVAPLALALALQPLTSRLANAGKSVIHEVDNVLLPVPKQNST